MQNPSLPVSAAISLPVLYKAFSLNTLVEERVAARWEVGYLVKSPSGRCWIHSVIDDNASTQVEVDPKTVCAATGLYDATPFDELTKEQLFYCRRIYGPDVDKNYRGIPLFEHDIIWYDDSASCEDDIKQNYGYITISEGRVGFTNALSADLDDLLFGDTRFDAAGDHKGLEARQKGSILIPADVTNTEAAFGEIWDDVTWMHRIRIAVYADVKDKPADAPSGDVISTRRKAKRPDQMIIKLESTVDTNDEQLAAEYVLQNSDIGGYTHPELVSWTTTHLGKVTKKTEGIPWVTNYNTVIVHNSNSYVHIALQVREHIIHASDEEKRENWNIIDTGPEFPLCKLTFDTVHSDEDDIKYRLTMIFDDDFDTNEDFDEYIYTKLAADLVDFAAKNTTDIVEAFVPQLFKSYTYKNGWQSDLEEVT